MSHLVTYGFDIVPIVTASPNCPPGSGSGWAAVPRGAVARGDAAEDLRGGAGARAPGRSRRRAEEEEAAEGVGVVVVEQAGK